MGPGSAAGGAAAAGGVVGAAGCEGESLEALARDVLARALSYDERGGTAEALRHYRLALELLGRGKALPADLRKLRASAEERVSFLAALPSPPRGRRPNAGGAAGPTAATTPGKRKLSGGRQLTKREVGGPARRKPNHAAASADAGPGGGSCGSARAPSPAGPPPDKYEQLIEEEILDGSPGVAWEDIVGATAAKRALKEMVVLPASRPDLFRGLRAPARGLLLYGPPGTGKTMLAKAVAEAARCTFFAISASSLTSKWVGESEKLVRALFRVAARRQPALVFIDEIDSLLSARQSGEGEGSRRLKTEFLIQFDGVGSGDAAVFVLGATNRPGELDDAVLRRLPKRIYLPLPDAAARRELVSGLLDEVGGGSLAGGDLDVIARLTAGYSGSDLTQLCKEAAMEPLRELGTRLATVPEDGIRAVARRDLEAAAAVVRPSVPQSSLADYDRWTQQFGTR